jgi:hypothetical protein
MTKRTKDVVTRFKCDDLSERQRKLVHALHDVLGPDLFTEPQACSQDVYMAVRHVLYWLGNKELVEGLERIISGKELS